MEVSLRLVKKEREPGCIETFFLYINNLQNKDKFSFIVSWIPVLRAIHRLIFWFSGLFKAITNLPPWQKALLIFEVIAFLITSIGMVCRSKGYIERLPLPVFPTLSAFFIVTFLFQLTVALRNKKEKYEPKGLSSITIDLPSNDMFKRLWP